MNSFGYVEAKDSFWIFFCLKDSKTSKKFRFSKNCGWKTYCETFLPKTEATVSWMGVIGHWSKTHKIQIKWKPKFHDKDCKFTSDFGRRAYNIFQNSCVYTPTTFFHSSVKNYMISVLWVLPRPGEAESFSWTCFQYKELKVVRICWKKLDFQNQFARKTYLRNQN